MTRRVLQFAFHITLCYVLHRSESQDIHRQEWVFCFFPSLPFRVRTVPLFLSFRALTVPRGRSSSRRRSNSRHPSREKKTLEDSLTGVCCCSVLVFRQTALKSVRSPQASTQANES